MNRFCLHLLVVLVFCGRGLAATTEPAGSPLTRAAFDRMDQRINGGNGYSGQATYPMLEFAWVVQQDPRLRARYGPKADRYVTEAAKVFRDAEEEWRDGPQPDEGYYVFGSRGCPFWADNVGKPFLRHIVDRGKWTMNDRVDGKAGFGQHDGMVGGWALLARWEPEVAPAAVKIGEAHKLQDQASGSALLSLARLIRRGER